MTYPCIGKYRVGQNIISCTNTSLAPSVPNRPEWGFLCSDCANAMPMRRPSFVPEILDTDKPNTPELEAYELEPGSNTLLEESEAEELAELRDLELDIEGLI